jgi:hypothetical protein
MKKNLAILIFILSLTQCRNSKDDIQYQKMMSLCEQLVLAYEPQMINDAETKENYCCEMPSLKNPEVDSFIQDCIKRRDSRPVKYACVLYHKYYFAAEKERPRSYYRHFSPSYKVGLLDLVDSTAFWSRGAGFDGIRSICTWCLREKKDIDDIEFVRKEYKKLKKANPDVRADFIF